MSNPAKVLLRKKIKDLMRQTSAETKSLQSKIIAEKVWKVLSIHHLDLTLKTVFQLFRMPEYQNAKRVSIYLSTDSEVDTINIMKKMFTEGKEVNCQ